MASSTIWMMGVSPCARNLAAIRSGSGVTLRQPSTASPNTVTDIYSSTTPRGAEALAAFAKLDALIRDTGRKLEEAGLEVWVSPGAGNEDDWRQEITFWKNAGIAQVTAHTTYISKHRRRVDSRSTAEHLAALTRYRAAVTDLL